MKKNFKEKNLRQNKGITLIALIITIIVLIILAGVTITGLVGRNGIMKRAREAKILTEQSSVRELVEMLVMESCDENGELITGKFQAAVEKEGGKVTIEGDKLKVEINGYEIEVDSTTGEIGKITKNGENIGNDDEDNNGNNTGGGSSGGDTGGTTGQGIDAQIETTQYQTTGETLSEDTKYSQIVLTVNITNKEAIDKAKGTIEVKVTKEDGTEIPDRGSVVGTGYKSYTVTSNEIYIVNVTTNVKGISKVTTAKEIVTQINTPDLSTRANGEIEVRFLSGSGNTITETANPPVLGANMRAVNFNTETNTWEKVSLSEWKYDYTAGKNEWANAVVEDNSGNTTGYFVWIPRYAYKIRYYNNSAHDILVGYSDSRGIVNSDGSVVTGGNSGRRNAGDNFIVHPCFTNDMNVGGWDKELQGIWVAKYEASGSTSNVKVLPCVESLRGTSSVEISIGTMYTVAKNYGQTSLNSHLIKNSEWGAAAYLSYSKYGIGRNKKVDLNINSGFITGGSNTEKEIYTTNKGQSTTGNAYGVYDMVGASYEYVASYINNGRSEYLTNGNSFTTSNKTQAKSNQYVTVYTASPSDSQKTNYELSGENMFGDAIYETSTSYWSNDASWQASACFFPAGSPFFYRGGARNCSNASVFYLYTGSGLSANIPDSCLRLVLAF